MSRHTQVTCVYKFYQVTAIDAALFAAQDLARTTEARSGECMLRSQVHTELLGATATSNWAPQVKSSLKPAQQGLQVYNIHPKLPGISADFKMG